MGVRELFCPYECVGTRSRALVGSQRQKVSLQLMINTSILYYIHYIEQHCLYYMYFIVFFIEEIY